MENDRRSGIDRRYAKQGGSTNLRTSKDRRKIISRFEHHLNILGKFPLFKHVTMSQFHSLLSICKQKVILKDEFIFQADESAESMFILIKGQFSVILPDGKVLTRINPPGIVGEMGIFTGEQRSATVISSKESITLIITNIELKRLFKFNSDLHVTILQNIVHDLSEKVRKDNKIIEFLDKNRGEE